VPPSPPPSATAVLAVDLDAAPLRLVMPAQQPHQGALAGVGETHQAHVRDELQLQVKVALFAFFAFLTVFFAFLAFLAMLPS